MLHLAALDASYTTASCRGLPKGVLRPRLLQPALDAGRRRCYEPLLNPQLHAANLQALQRVSCM